MEKTPSEGQSPIFLRILVVAGLIGCFQKMILVISPPIQSVGSWYPVYFSISTVVLIICLTGFWLMKRWSFFLFVPYVLIDQWVYWHFDRWPPLSLPLMAALLITALFYFRRFER